MKNTIQCERGIYEVFYDDLPVARLYEFENEVKVHMYRDSYEFKCDSLETAYPLIQIRQERPFCN